MLTYIVVLIVVWFLSLAVSKYTGGNFALAQRQKLNNRVALFLSACILVVVAGFRYYVGADYGNYVRLYLNRNELSLSDIWNALLSFEEPGYGLVCLISSKIYNSYVTMFFVSSLITIVPAIMVIYKKSCNFTLSMLLYIMLVWTSTFGAIRQCLAATIVLCAFKYLEQRDFIRYVFVVVLAALFHFTALLMIPLYFLLGRKASWKNTVLIVALTVVIRYSYDAVFNLIGVYKGGELGTYSYITSSVNVFRVLVAFAPMILLFFAKRPEKNGQEERTYDLCINFVLVHATLMYAMANSTYLARASIYTTSFLPIVMPELMRKYDKKTYVIIVSVMFGAYFIYWMYGIRTQGLNYQSIFGL